MKNKMFIGIIDSGIGGLSVVKEIIIKFPNEKIIYLCDSLNCPYGIKKKKEIIKLSLKMINFLLKKNIKLLIIACNTITSFILEKIRKKIKIIVIGVINSSVKFAIKKTINKRIGIIGTIATINSNIYKKKINEKNKFIKVFNLKCSYFVTIVENFKINEKLFKIIIFKKLNKFILLNKIDTLILGCTHYSFLKEIINLFFKSKIFLIDSSIEVLDEISYNLKKFKILNFKKNNKFNYIFYTTGNIKKLKNKIINYLNLKKFIIKNIIL